MIKKIFLIGICMLFFISSFGSAALIYSNHQANPLNIKINENTPPNPPVISGPSNGKIRETYEYHFLLTDPDEADFMYALEIDFGDEIVTEGGAGCGKTWLNGTILDVSHQWTTKGDYEIRARAVDSFGEWSEWSEPYPVSMPKNNHLQLIVQLMNDEISIKEYLISLMSYFN